MPLFDRETPYKIAAVDDSRSILMYLSDTLKRQGYEVSTYQDSKIALDAMIASPPDLILLDINMPQMSGYDLCRLIKASAELNEKPVIFVSSESDKEVKVKSFGLGAADYIKKPFEPEELNARIQTHLRLTELNAKQKRDNKSLKNLVAEQIAEISAAQLGTIKALAILSEYRDEDTGSHLSRVSDYCRILGNGLLGQKKFLVTKSFIDAVAEASPLHDIGKVAISDSILLKPGKLTASEFDTMKTHTTIGAKTLKSVLNEDNNHNIYLSIGAEIALSHHEKWDGTGYPFRLLADDIPLSGRIMAIADVYDALRAKRCYKPSFSHEKSRDIIINDSGAHFDPELVKVFIAREKDFDNVWKKHSDGKLE